MRKVCITKYSSYEKILILSRKIQKNIKIKLNKASHENFTTDFVWCSLREKYHLDLTFGLNLTMYVLLPQIRSRPKYVLKTIFNCKKFAKGEAQFVSLVQCM